VSVIAATLARVRARRIREDADPGCGGTTDAVLGRERDHRIE
jgi:hypothetical protein